MSTPIRGVQTPWLFTLPPEPHGGRASLLYRRARHRSFPRASGRIAPDGGLRRGSRMTSGDVAAVWRFSVRSARAANVSVRLPSVSPTSRCGGAGHRSRYVVPAGWGRVRHEEGVRVLNGACPVTAVAERDSRPCAPRRPLVWLSPRSRSLRRSGLSWRPGACYAARSSGTARPVRSHGPSGPSCARSTLRGARAGGGSACR